MTRTTRSTTTDLAVPLRAWARGMYPAEAAVELLLRGFGGRFARPGNPWIITPSRDPNNPGPDSGRWVWVDGAALSEHGAGGPYSGGERRFLAIVASLLDGGAPVRLDDMVPGLDRDLVALVLAALAHTAGSHEHSRLVPDPATGTVQVERLGSLYPWPPQTAQAVR